MLPGACFCGGAMKKEFLEAGKIVNTHGVKGEVKIQPWASYPEFLLEQKRLYINEQPVKILEGRVHKGSVIALLEGVGDINAAMSLKGRLVFIKRSEVKLDEGEFFIQDIIGASVKTEDGTVLGSLAEVMERPGGSIYRVEGDREILIPVVPEFVLKTDAEGGEIIVRLIEGM